MMKFHDFSGDRNAPSTAYQNSIESFGPKCSQADNDSWILSISNENQRKTIKKWVKDNEIGKIPMNFLSRHFLENFMTNFLENFMTNFCRLFPRFSIFSRFHCPNIEFMFLQEFCEFQWKQVGRFAITDGKITHGKCFKFFPPPNVDIRVDKQSAKKLILNYLR